MIKKNKVNVLNLIAWFTGIIVSLAVAFGMVGKTLTIPYIPILVTQFFGWIVVITTLVGAVLAIIRK